MKKIILFLLFFSFCLSVKALDNREVITNVEATSNISSILEYASIIEKPTFNVSVGEGVNFLNNVDEGWEYYNGSKWISVFDGYRFNSGKWRYRAKLDVVGNNAETHRLGSQTTLKVNGEDWYFSYCSSCEVEGTAYSPNFILDASGNLEFFRKETYYIYPSFTGIAINSFSVNGSVEGGTPPYVFTKTSGPSWINVSTSGSISGTPTNIGKNDNLVVRVTDQDENYKEITIPVEMTGLPPAERELIELITATSNTASIPVLNNSIVKPTFNVTSNEGSYFTNYNCGWYKLIGSNWVLQEEGKFTPGKWQYRTQVNLDGDNALLNRLSDETIVMVDDINWNAQLYGTSNESYTLSVNSPEYTIIGTINKIELESNIKEPKIGEDIEDPIIWISSINEDSNLINIGEVEAHWQYKTGDTFFDWEDATGKFEINKTYHIRLMINIDSEIYELDNVSTFPVTLNGYKLTQFQLNNKSVGEFIKFKSEADNVYWDKNIGINTLYSTIKSKGLDTINAKKIIFNDISSTNSNYSSENSVDISSLGDNSVKAVYLGTTLYIQYSGTLKFNSNSSFLFQDYRNVENIEGFEYVDTSNVTNMSGMFWGCNSLKSLDLSSFNTSKVTNMSNMFGNCESLNTLNISNFNTSNVTNMYSMFHNTYDLSNINLSSFNTSKVTNMSTMFAGSGLTELNISNFNTSKVTNMSFMFTEMKKIESLNLSNFNTSNVVNMLEMFAYSKKIKNLVVNRFDTSKVTNMENMFCDTGIEVLDISSFKTDNVKNMHSMFAIKTLKTIYASSTWTTKSLQDGNNMFLNAELLVGGNGTVYDEDYLDQTYARIDENGSKGYFTNSKNPILCGKVEATIKSDNNKVTLTWNKQNVASKYVVYRSTDGKKFKQLKVVETNTLNDKDLTYGKKYYYKLKACNNLGCGSYSNILNKKVVPNKVNLKIDSAGSNNVKLSWNKVSVTGYQIYQSTDNKKWSKIKTITKNSTLSFNKTKLKANKKYYYKVRAYKTVGKTKVYGSYSSVVSTKTAPVKSKLTLSLRDYNEINIKFSGVSGASKYLVDRSLDGKTYTRITDLPKEGTLASGEQEVGKTYYYRVKACNKDNRCSGWVKGRLKQTTKVPGYSLKTSSKKVTITLNKVNGADGYQIYRATSKKGKYTLAKEFSSEVELLKYDNKTTKGKTYYFKVRSYKIVNEKRVYSPYSGIKSIKSK